MPSPEHGASTSARSNPLSSGGSARPSAQTTETFVAPSRRTFSSSSRARPGCFSTATTSPASIVAFPPGAAHRSSVRSPSREPTARPASCDPRLCGQTRPSASAGSSIRVDAVRVRDVRRVAVDLAADEPHDRLRRIVLGAHERECVLFPPLPPPGLGDPVGIGMGESSLRGSPCGKVPEREPPQDGVRELHGPFQPRLADELHGLAHRRIGGDRIQVGELVGADPESGAHRRVELAHRAAADLLERVVERADALDGAVGDPLGQRAVALVEAGGGGCESAVGVGVLLEDAEDDVVGDTACRRDHRLDRAGTGRPAPRNRRRRRARARARAPRRGGRARAGRRRAGRAGHSTPRADSSRAPTRGSRGTAARVPRGRTGR